MDTRNITTLSLRADETARLPDGAQLHVTRGRLWLTLDGDPADRVLTAGDRHVVPRRGLALVQALDAPTTATVVTLAPRRLGWRPRLATAMKVSRAVLFATQCLLAAHGAAELPLARMLWLEPHGASCCSRPDAAG